MIMARVVMSTTLVIAATGSAPVYAAAWILSEQASANVGYDDNVRLSTINVAVATNISSNVSAHWVRQSDALSWSIDPHLAVIRYTDYSMLNHSEEGVVVTGQQQTERRNSTVSFNWVQDTTLTSELGFTGFSEVNKRHQASVLTVSQTEQWSERFDVQTQLYAASNRYIDAANTGLVNYNYGSAQLSGDYALTERTQLSLDSSIGKLQVPGISNYGKTNASVMLSYSAVFADRWHAKLSYGPSSVRSERSNDQGTVYAVNISRKSATSNLQLAISRDITPTGQGVLTRRQQFTLSASRALSERLSTSITGILVKNDSQFLTNNLNFYGVRYSDLTANLSWNWTPTLTVSLSAGHSDQRIEQAARTAMRNHAALNITWSGLARTLH